MTKRRHYKKSWLENLFNGVIKLIISIVALTTLTFILISGNIQLSVSFNKEKSSPASLIERVGQGLRLVKVGYNTAGEMLK